MTSPKNSGLPQTRRQTQTMYVKEKALEFQCGQYAPSEYIHHSVCDLRLPA